jgi:tetratricopeptide (TPR) repeat protein
MKSRVFRVVARWGFGLALELWAFRKIHHVFNGSPDILSAFAGCLFGFAALISGAFFFLPELAPLVAAPVVRFFSGFVFPNETGKAPLDYTLARFYAKNGRLAEALEQYFKILENYPQELAAYREGLEVARSTGDTAAAERLAKMALRKLKDPAAREEFLRLGQS